MASRHDPNDHYRAPLPHLHPVMNDTKWEELRLAMDELHPSPEYAVLSTNEYRAGWDREWFYHFRSEPYGTILHLEIRTDDHAQHEQVRSALQRIHVPGEETSEGFRVFGYLRSGQYADYL